MSIVNYLKQFWKKYMNSSIENLDSLTFPPDEEKRFQIIFSGVVQGVGFRYETWRIAEKFGLTGFVII